MNQPHLTSGGRYPVLRTIGILYLLGAVLIVVLGVWRAINVLRQGNDDVSSDLFGAPTGSGRILVAVSWIATSFIGALLMVGIAELIKLFMDIEYNTRRAAHHAAPAGTTQAEVDAGRNGPGVPIVGAGEKKWIDGDETAEGALIRGH